MPDPFDVDGARRPGPWLTAVAVAAVVVLEVGTTAAIWFGPDFVQVRWFTGGQEPCESFTVTVAGATEDGNRHAAVDFAERILLPSDLAESRDAARGTIEGEWPARAVRYGGRPLHPRADVTPLWHWAWARR